MSAKTVSKVYIIQLLTEFVSEDGFTELNKNFDATGYIKTCMKKAAMFY